MPAESCASQCRVCSVCQLFKSVLQFFVEKTVCFLVGFFFFSFKTFFKGLGLFNCKARIVQD